MDVLTDRRQRIGAAQVRYLHTEVLAPLAAAGPFVPGEGPLDAPVMLVGEAPGAQEARLLRPFCGPSGQLLRRLMKEAGVPPPMCYITNAVHYRPPFNRTPHPYEVIASLPLLEEEAAAVLPQVIVALGAVALRALAYRLPPPALGEMVSWQFPAWHRVMLLPLRHPSWVLREGPAAEDEMREGLRKIIGG